MLSVGFFLIFKKALKDQAFIELDAFAFNDLIML